MFHCQWWFFKWLIVNLEHLFLMIKAFIVWCDWNFRLKIFLIFFRHFRKWNFPFMASESKILSSGITFGIHRTLAFERNSIYLFLMPNQLVLIVVGLADGNFFNFWATHACSCLWDFLVFCRWLGSYIIIAVIAHNLAKFCALTLRIRSR